MADRVQIVNESGTNYGFPFRIQFRDGTVTNNADGTISVNNLNDEFTSSGFIMTDGSGTRYQVTISGGAFVITPIALDLFLLENSDNLLFEDTADTLRQE